MMGAAVEFAFQPDRADYLCGEDVFTPGGLRSMQNPTQFGDPDHYSIRFTGSRRRRRRPHQQRHRQQRLLPGDRGRAAPAGRHRPGRRSGANRAQIERVFYRAFTAFLTPSSNFAQARAATIQAARELYGIGGAVEAAVTQAWTASASASSAANQPSSSMNPIARRLGPQALAAAFVIAFAAPATAPDCPPAPVRKPRLPKGRPGARGPRRRPRAAAGDALQARLERLAGALDPELQRREDAHRVRRALHDPHRLRDRHRVRLRRRDPGERLPRARRPGRLLAREPRRHGSVDVSLPHPLYLNRPRTASAELSSYGYSESAAISTSPTRARAGKLDWAVFAGVTLFQVEADLLSAPTFDERYPYDTLAIVATPAAAAEGDAIGFNVGGRLDFLIGTLAGRGRAAALCHGQRRPVGGRGRERRDARRGRLLGRRGRALLLLSARNPRLGAPASPLGRAIRRLTLARDSTLAPGAH